MIELACLSLLALLLLAWIVSMLVGGFPIWVFVIIIFLLAGAALAVAELA